MNNTTFQLDTDTIASLTQIALQNGAILALLSFIMISLLMWRRTRSTHVLLARLWALFNGKVDCADPHIKDFLSTQSALMQFRFMTGLPARTLQHARSLCSWATEHNEDMGDIAVCGDYFDLDLPTLKHTNKLPRRWQLISAIGLFAVVSMLTYGLIVGAFYDRAIVQIKGSGTWLTLGEGYASPLFQGTGIKLKECTSNHAQLAVSSGFRQSDVDVLCTIFVGSKVETYTATTVVSQRVAFGLVALVSLVISVTLARWLRSGITARDMRRRIDALELKSTPAEIAEKDMQLSALA